MAKTVKELYPVRVNVNGRYSHKFKLPRASAPEKKGRGPLVAARKLKGE